MVRNEPMFETLLVGATMTCPHLTLPAIGMGAVNWSGQKERTRSSETMFSFKNP